MSSYCNLGRVIRTEWLSRVGARDRSPMLKRVAFVCAMPMEMNPLRRKLSLKKTVIGSVEIYAGSLGDLSVIGIVTGIGSELAAHGVERLVEEVDIKQIVVVGIAGAVNSETQIGALVQPVTVVNGATGDKYRPTQLGESIPRGTMWTSDELITDLDTIARLRADGVISLDMETAAIAEICQRRSIPWSVYRSISDRATDASLDGEVFDLINRDGTFNITRVCAFIVRHPGRLPALARIARDATLAAKNAAAAAIDAVSYPSPNSPMSQDT